MRKKNSKKLKDDVSKTHAKLKKDSKETETGLKYFINEKGNGEKVDEQITID